MKAVSWKRGALLSVGLLGSMQGFSSAAPSTAAAAAAPQRLPKARVPVEELSKLHRRFGGDASIWDNRPMPQQAPSGGTISALSVQIPALEALAPYLQEESSEAFDLGFGSGVMVGMLLAVAGKSTKVVGVDLGDKIAVAKANLLQSSKECPYTPFSEKRFTLLGGDAFSYLKQWREEESKIFDVVYSGCSMDPRTDQLRLFLAAMKPTGAAVFNLGTPGEQSMYFVADGGRICQRLMRVNFMMAVSPDTPVLQRPPVPLEPLELSRWIQDNVFNKAAPEL